MENEYGKKEENFGYMVKALFVYFCLSIVLLISVFPLSYIVSHGIGKDTSNYVNKFFTTIKEDPLSLFGMYDIWFKQLVNYHGAFNLSMWIPILPFVAMPLGMLYAYLSVSFLKSSNTEHSASSKRKRIIENDSSLKIKDNNRHATKTKSRRKLEL